jgi:hypothetical protein
MNLESWPGQLALIAGAFVVGTLVAALFGAANLGTAMSVGVLAFAATYMWVIVRR